MIYMLIILQKSVGAARAELLPLNTMQFDHDYAQDDDPCTKIKVETFADHGLTLADFQPVSPFAASDSGVSSISGYVSVRSAIHNSYLLHLIKHNRVVLFAVMNVFILLFLICLSVF